MTKSTITRERAQQIFLGNGPEPSASEERELARMTLVAMDNEPVAWTDEEELRDVNVAGIGYLFGIDREANKFADPRRQIMLYRHAQPGPVVPDDTKLRELFDSWFASDCSFDLSPEASEADNIAWRESYWYVWKRCRAAMLQAGNSPVIPDGYVMVPKEPTEEMLRASYREASVYSATAYRAMLAASQHDTPALNSLQSVDSVAGKWIPVSERMPEDRISVILWDAEIGEVTSGHYSHKTHTFYHCGDAIQNEITHWMPPPADPQEVNHG